MEELLEIFPLQYVVVGIFLFPALVVTIAVVAMKIQQAIIMKKRARRS